MNDKIDAENFVVRVTGASSGTGVLVDSENGLILTCAHVLGDEKNAEVSFETNANSIPAEVVMNWSPEVDLALLRVSHQPPGLSSPVLDIRVRPNKTFISRGFHYSFGNASIPIQGQIRGLGGNVNNRQAIILSSIEVAEGVSGGPIIEESSGCLIGIIQRYHKNERWLAVGIPISEFISRWPDATKLTFEHRYRNLVSHVLAPKHAAYSDLSYRSGPYVSHTKNENLLQNLSPNRFFSYQELIAAIEKYRGIVLIGEPGSGKTLTVEKIAYEFSRNSEIVPVLMNLRDFQKKVPILENIALLCQNNLIREFQANVDPSLAFEFDMIMEIIPEKLEDVFNNGKACVIFDGLDQLLINDPENISLIYSFARKLVSQRNIVIFTCRAMGYSKISASTNFEVFFIEPLNNKQIEQFVEKFSLQHDVNYILHRLKEPTGEDYYDICRIPLFLYLWLSQQPPIKWFEVKRTTIIENYLMSLIEQEVRRINSDVTPSEILIGLSLLATFVKDSPGFSLIEIKKKLTEILDVHLVSTLLTIGQNASVLDRQYNGSEFCLYFRNRLVQDVLVSNEIFRKSRGEVDMLYEIIQPYIGNDNWFDIISMAVSRLTNSSKIVQILLRRYSQENSNHLFLLLCIAIIVEGSEVDADTRRQTVNESVAFIRRKKELKSGGGSTQILKMTVLRLLSKIAWDAYTVSRLNDAVQDEDLDIWIRLQILEHLLATQFSQGSVSVLKGIVKDYDRNGWASLSALDMLENRKEIVVEFAADITLHPRVRVECVRILSQLGETESAKTLLLDLVALSPELVITSIEVESILGGPETIRELSNIVIDEKRNGIIRLQALVALVDIDQNDSFLEPWLLMISSKHLEPTVTKSAIVTVVERKFKQFQFVDKLKMLGVDSGVVLEIARVLIKASYLRDGLELLLFAMNKDVDMIEQGAQIIGSASRSVANQPINIMPALATFLLHQNLTEKARSTLTWAIEQIKYAQNSAKKG